MSKPETVAIQQCRWCEKPVERETKESQWADVDGLTACAYNSSQSHEVVVSFVWPKWLLDDIEDGL